jgi:hypothetical protein
MRAPTAVRVRVEIMGSPKCGRVGKSQPVLIMIHPIIFTRTRRGPSSWTWTAPRPSARCGSCRARARASCWLRPTESSRSWRPAGPSSCVVLFGGRCD